MVAPTLALSELVAVSDGLDSDAKKENARLAAAKESDTPRQKLTIAVTPLQRTAKNREVKPAWAAHPALISALEEQRATAGSLIPQKQLPAVLARIAQSRWR